MLPKKCICTYPTFKPKQNTVSGISLPTNLLNQLNNSSKQCSHFLIRKIPRNTEVGL